MSLVYNGNEIQIVNVVLADEQMEVCLWSSCRFCCFSPNHYHSLHRELTLSCPKIVLIRIHLVINVQGNTLLVRTKIRFSKSPSWSVAISVLTYETYQKYCRLSPECSVLCLLVLFVLLVSVQLLPV